MVRKVLVKKDPRDMTLAGARLTATGIVFDGKITFDQWEGIGQYLERCEGAVQWWIGDWLNCGEGEPRWGDKYEQAIGIFNRPYKTLTDYRAIANHVKFPERSGNLSWSHHAAVAYEPPDVRRQLLAEAEPEAPDKPPRLSVAELKKRARKIRQGRETPPLPAGQYRVLCADPPWKYNDQRTASEGSGSETGAAVAEYDLLDTDVICALHNGGRAVQDLAARDSALFLWVTAPMLPDGLRVMAAWGFKYRAQFVWNKVRGYNGHYNNVVHELLLIGTRGSAEPASAPLVDGIVTIEKTAHSRKPDRFYEIIESMYPDGPYIELFARNTRKGWDSWGNQA